MVIFWKYSLWVMVSARNSFGFKPHYKGLEVAGYWNRGFVKLCVHNKVIQLHVLGSSKENRCTSTSKPFCSISELCFLLATGVDRDKKKFFCLFAVFPFEKVHQSPLSIFHCAQICEVLRVTLPYLMEITPGKWNIMLLQIASFDCIWNGLF